MSRFLPSSPVRLAAILWVVGLAAVARAQTVPGRATVAGVVVDSVRDRFLPDAVVRLEPGGREALTSENGSYAFTGVPPGRYRLRVLHLMLDSLGLAVVTPEFVVDSTPGRVDVPIAVPPPARVVSAMCPAAQLLRGPAAITGFVRDPDTEIPVVGARVTLLYMATADPTGLINDRALRETRTDSAGRYVICGIPTSLKGQLQAGRDGLLTADVPLDATAILHLRGLQLALSPRASATGDSAGARLLVGAARLAGRVLGRNGEPIEGARVTVRGAAAITVTGRNGEFSLDSLPAGTHAVETRKVGYAPAEKAVDLISNATASVNITLGNQAVVLAPVTSVAQRDQDLERVGFTRRQKMQGGYFYEGARLNTLGTSFSESLREVPSLRVVRVGDLDSRYVVTSRRDPAGCVNFVVDGFRWRTSTPGDIDEAVRPDEVRALEVYDAATVPAEFADPARGKCVTIVIWTSARVRGRGPG